MAESRPYKLPLPRTGGLSAEFYRFCRQHELRFQRCTKCGTFEWEWALSSGRGKVFSWTTVMQPMMPHFAEQVPYSPVIVELDEGVRMVTWVTDVPPGELKIGLPVEVVFDDVTPEVSLPKFRRAT